jgi:hypothetical protein
MVKPFNELRERLLQAGVAPRHARRYLNELADHLVDLQAEEERAGRNRADAESAALTRLGGMDDLAKAMTEQPQFQSWCARSPWAMFGLAPLALLAGAWSIALFILWSGWEIFLPGAATPFGVHGAYGFANWYFQAGKALYFGGPILVGWAIALIAARQRFKAVWPAVGLVLIALMSASAQVHARRPAVPGSAGHISMSFTLGTSVQDISYSLLHALVILALVVLPYLFWQLQKARAFSD